MNMISEFFQVFLS